MNSRGVVMHTDPSKNAVSGRERYDWFHWYGTHSWVLLGLQSSGASSIACIFMILVLRLGCTHCETAGE